VGMTTAPREKPTLERTLESTQSTGWETIHVFAEPNAEVPRGEGISVSQRPRTLGVFANWFLGLSELVYLEPDADAYLMLQDDIVFTRNVRAYLESQLWPKSRIGLVSIYCPEPYAQRNVGFHEIESGALLGALTWILPRGTATWLVTTGAAHIIRQSRFLEQCNRFDTSIGHLLNRVGLPAFYHSPSLADHIGETSTLWPGIPATNARQPHGFLGERYDAMQLFP
jgi:hypothetical protein